MLAFGWRSAKSNSQNPTSACQSDYQFPYRAENLWSKSHNMGIKTEWTTTLFDQNDDCDKFWHNTILEFRCWRLPIRNCVVGESPCEGKYQSILRCITCNRIYFLLILLARNQPDKLKFALYVNLVCFEIGLWLKVGRGLSDLDSSTWDAGTRGTRPDMFACLLYPQRKMC